MLSLHPLLGCHKPIIKKAILKEIDAGKKIELSLGNIGENSKNIEEELLRIPNSINILIANKIHSR